MRSVKLANTDLTASSLGFGCSALLGDNTRTEGLQLLHTAYDEGLNYFDVARVYGYGEAERLVGEFAKGKRSRIVITTKFGIRPLISIAGAGYARTLVRNLMRFSPSLRNRIGRQARSAVSHGRFGAAEARDSLETSLRVLGTDYIDIFLMHDCSLGDISDDLLVFLSRARAEGKIRYFGVATEAEEIAKIQAHRPEFALVMQFRNSVLHRNLEALGEPGGAVITHGALSGSYVALREYLARGREFAARWSSCLQADLSQPTELARIMLNYAVHANRWGPVIFSSRQVESIKNNAKGVAEDPYSKEQLEAFVALAKQSGVQPL